MRALLSAAARLSSADHRREDGEKGLIPLFIPAGICMPGMGFLPSKVFSGEAVNIPAQGAFLLGACLLNKPRRNFGRKE